MKASDIFNYFKKRKDAKKSKKVQELLEEDFIGSRCSTFVGFGSNRNDILEEQYAENILKLENYKHLAEEQKKIHKGDFYKRHSSSVNGDGKTEYSLELQQELFVIQNVLDTDLKNLTHVEVAKVLKNTNTKVTLKVNK